MYECETEKLIRLSRCFIGEQEKQAVLEVMDRGFLGMGVEVQAFEQKLEAYFGRPVVCVVNGTAALHLALQAAGLGVGDEVLVQSMTYIASFQAISATGAKPVACDVDPDTLTIDWRDAERRLTPRTKAIMPMHYSGGVGALADIYAFAKRHQLRVIEDAAHAFGTQYVDKKVGSFGDIACFSFDGIKNITAGEGGCIVTTDEMILNRARDARLLGVEKDTDNRFEGKRSWSFDVSTQGWRYHMSDIMAAIGLRQFERLPEIIKKRQQLAMRYDELLSPYSQIVRIHHDYNRVVPHIYAIRVLGLMGRDKLRDKFLLQNIQTGVHYQPNHYLSYYDETRSLPLPVTEQTYPELLTLPLHPGMEEEDVQRVVKVLTSEMGQKWDGKIKHNSVHVDINPI